MIPLLQVNFLVGENSSGKSSVLELLTTFFSYSFWSIYPGLDRKILENRHFTDLVSINSDNRKNFTIGSICQEEDGKIIATLTTYIENDGRTVASTHSSYNGGTITTVKINKNNTASSKSEFAPEDATSNLALLKAWMVSHHQSVKGFHIIPETKDKNFPIDYAIYFANRRLIKEESAISYQNRIPKFFSRDFVELAPIRTRPLRTYDQPQTSYSPEGDHTPYVIRKHIKSKSGAEQFKKTLARIGKDSGLFKSISIKEYKKTSVSPFELDITLDQNALSIDNVGYGVSQALPIFVEMLVQGKNTAFSIQQPEVHLHPRAQATVGDFVAEVAKHEAKFFFIETHSDHTIDRFRIHVKKHQAKFKSQVLFFEKKSGENIVTALPINDDGTIDVPKDCSYRDFFLNEQMELLS